MTGITTVGGRLVTAPRKVISSVLLRTVGLRTPLTFRVIWSPVSIVFGTVNVTTFVPPPLNAAVTVPLPEGVVLSAML